MSESERRAAGPPVPGVDAAYRRLRALALGYAALAVAVIAAGMGGSRLAEPVPWAVGAMQDGLLAVAAGALLVAAAGLAATALILWARGSSDGPVRAMARTRLGRLRRRIADRLGPPPGARAPWAAGWPQALILLGLGGAAGLAVIRWWPQAATAMPHDRFVLGGATLAAVFPLLVAERAVAGLSRARLPEAPELAMLLRLPVVALPAWACLEIAVGLGLGWAGPLRAAPALLALAVAVELVLRMAARWFLPPPDPAGVRASVASLAAGLLRPAALSPAAMSRGLRDRFGIDFARSWALAYVRDALAPVALALLLFCWVLTGVVTIGLNERGSYERFGESVAILRPGLHLVAPWPFGVIRRVEYGVIHSVAATAEADAPAPAPELAGAEDPAPASADRLWEQPHPGEGTVLVASESGGRQSFQVVNADIRVLYRIGLDDAAARQAVYNAADPDALVHAYAGRRLARFFANQTLLRILGENEDREAIAGALKAALQQDLDALASGIEVLAVMIEAIHPPSGAADAYHNVQAAEITATATISTETGRAEATANLSLEEAEDRVNKATADAAELVGRERAAFRGFQADVLANRAAGRAFPLERYLSNLSAALAKAPLVIVDHRLDSRDAPVLDLRPLAGAAAGATTGNED